MVDSLVFALVLVATSALTVVGAVLVAGAVSRPRRRSSATDLGTNRLDAVFLFDGGTLVDANDRATALLRSIRPADGKSGTGDAWACLSRFLGNAFPDLAARIESLAQIRSVELSASDGSGLGLMAEWLDGTLRLTISDSTAEDGSVMIDQLSYRALDDELGVLRRANDRSPVLTWRENVLGHVIWANGAYLRTLAASGKGNTSTWPLPALFPPGEPGSEQRMELCGTKGASPRWFSVSREPDEGGQIAFAMPADDAFRAEKTKREFIQTLTKTFATLPIGLAVFDRTRRLQMFNPALTDLTRLETEFLLSRPGLEGFLNRMRDKRVLPEPRDYQSWSRRLLEIEKGAGTTDFEESWTLPSGQTFRVSVSPHPDGALAFLIEDITSEIHMTRNFRAELEVTQAAFDMLDPAIAVFAPGGQLLMTNRAFSRLWTIEGDDTLGGFSLSEALMNWRDISAETGLWDRLAALGAGATRSEEPAEVAGIVTLEDGATLGIQARRSTNGALMIAFDEPGLRCSPPVTTTTRDTSERDHGVIPTPRRSASYRGGAVTRASA